MKITRIKAAPSEGYISVSVNTDEGEVKLTVSLADYADIGSPEKDAELSYPEYTAITLSDESYRAKITALRILGYADNNERTLVRKLAERGISREVACKTAKEMIELGYIDEKRQLLRLVSHEANASLYGKRRILAKLAQKGYAPKDISDAIDTLTECAEIDFDLLRDKLIAKKLTRGATDEQIKTLLYKYGY